MVQKGLKPTVAKNRGSRGIRAFPLVIYKCHTFLESLWQGKNNDIKSGLPSVLIEVYNCYLTTRAVAPLHTITYKNGKLWNTKPKWTRDFI